MQLFFLLKYVLSALEFPDGANLINFKSLHKNLNCALAFDNLRKFLFA